MNAFGESVAEKVANHALYREVKQLRRYKMEVWKRGVKQCHGHCGRYYIRKQVKSCHFCGESVCAKCWINVYYGKDSEFETQYCGVECERKGSWTINYEKLGLEHKPGYVRQELSDMDEWDREVIGDLPRGNN